MKVSKTPIAVLNQIKGKDIPYPLKKYIKHDPDKTYKITLEVESVKKEKGGKVEKGKWAKMAEKMAKENCLDGMSEQFLKASRQFRSNFSFRKPPFDNR